MDGQGARSGEDRGTRSLPVSSLPVSSLPVSSLPVSSLPIWYLPMSFGLECGGHEDAAGPMLVNDGNTILTGKGIRVGLNEGLERGVGL
jgi:hypothetical protein